MDTSGDERKHLKQLLEHFHTGMLVTTGPDGYLRARPMALAAVEGDDELWFATGKSTAKAHEIRKDSHVTVTMQDSARYVAMIGDAELVDDRAKIDELWSEMWRTWFPDGKDDPEIVLVRVRAHRGEFWDNSGTKGLAYLWESAKAYLTRTTPTVPVSHHAAVRT